MIERKFLHCCFLIFVLIFVNACVNSRTATVTTNAEVNRSGYLVYYKTTISLPASSYHDFVKSISSKKYSSIREYFLRDYGYSNSFFDTNEQTGDPTVITFLNKVPIPPDKTPQSISVKIQNNQVFFNDSSYSSDYFIQKAFVKELKYSVTLPVKIEKGNYHTQSKDGYSVAWTYKNDANAVMVNNPVDIPTLYVISEIANENNVKPIETPGFVLMGAIISLILIGLNRRWRK